MVIDGVRWVQIKPDPLTQCACEGKDRGISQTDCSEVIRIVSLIQQKIYIRRSRVSSGKQSIDKTTGNKC